MKIAVIGGGLTGLAAAYTLSRNGHSVSLFEKDSVLGGLAHGFKAPGWEWPLEFTYHHFFTNDKSLISLAKNLGMENDLIISRPITAAFLPNSENKTKLSDHEIRQLDSALSLLKFKRLSIWDRLRTGALLGFCKVNPFWQPLESITAENFIKFFGGHTAWKTIWEPLLYGKFNIYADSVAASWFWARIKKRTPSLGYFRGGFQSLIERLADEIRKRGGQIYTSSDITFIRNVSGALYQVSWRNMIEQFNKILLTIPTPIADKLLASCQTDNLQPTSHNPIPHLHAQMLILETDKPILNDIYWLNINDRSFPFLAAVAHTNFMDRKYYGGHHLTYFGNYLPDGHPYLKMTKQQVLNLFTPYIKQLITDNRQLTTYNSFLFTAPFAQPVHKLHYSQKAPRLETGIPGIYLVNMDSIFPWDRGINYAVELGQKSARFIIGGQK